MAVWWKGEKEMGAVGKVLEERWLWWKRREGGWGERHRKVKFWILSLKGHYRKVWIRTRCINCCALQIIKDHTFVHISSELKIPLNIISVNETYSHNRSPNEIWNKNVEIFFWTVLGQRCWTFWQVCWWTPAGWLWLARSHTSCSLSWTSVQILVVLRLVMLLAILKWQEVAKAWPWPQLTPQPANYTTANSSSSKHCSW